MEFLSFSEGFTLLKNGLHTRIAILNEQNDENPFGIECTMGYVFSHKPTLWGLIGLIIKDGQNGILDELPVPASIPPL